MQLTLSERSIAYRWLVLYNPLYFASALCIFVGLFLVARSMPPDDFASKLGVAGCTEAYQALLIGGAALLLRDGKRRPAAILGLMAVVFLFDAALNGERIFSHAKSMSLAPGMRARVALPASVVLALLGPIKLWILSRVFRLSKARSILLPAAATLFALPLFPYVIEALGPSDANRQGAHLVLFWLGALLLGWMARPRSWTSLWAEDDPRMVRIANVLPIVIVGLYLLHAGLWSALPNLGLSPAHVAPFALVAACVAVRRWGEPAAWVGTAAALGAALYASPLLGRWPVATVALMSSATLFGLVRSSGLRVLMPATVCAFVGAYGFVSGPFGPLAEPGMGWPAALAVALIVCAETHGDFRSLVASSLAVASMLVSIPPFGLLLGGMWFAGWSWILFPSLRGWVPLAATVGVLALGAAMLLNETPHLSLWYASTTIMALGVGVGLHRKDFQVTGVAGFGPLAVSERAHWIPAGAGGWGVVLLVAGFVCLLVGIGLNHLIVVRRSVPGAHEETST